MYFCSNYELFIQDEFVDKVTAENLTEAKEMLGPKVLKSLQETCFTVEVFLKCIHNLSIFK